MEIQNLKSIIESGKQVAFVKGNRKINSKNVKVKTESFKSYGGNLVPIMYVSGEKAIADDCQLVDLAGIDIPAASASGYIVIIDGQHRIKAALEMKLPQENLMLFEAYADATTQELLAESNVSVSTWSNADFVSGALLFQPDCTEVQFIEELSSEGYPLVNISSIVCGKRGVITRKKLATLMTTGRLDFTCNLERAKLFLENALKAFDHKFVSKRYLIDAVMDLSTEEGYKRVYPQIANLTVEDKRRIEDANADDKEAVITMCLKRLLEESATATAA